MANDNFNSGPGNPRGRPKGKGISSYLRDLLEIQDIPSGQPKHKLIAQKMIDIALAANTSHRDFITLTDMIMDRLEGKAVNTNINADLTDNIFDGIDTAKLEALKKRLEEIKA